jgi:hypothetical protein
MQKYLSNIVRIPLQQRVLYVLFVIVYGGNSRDRAARKGYQARAVGTKQLGQVSHDRAVVTVHPGQNSQDRIIRTGYQGQDG